MKFDRYQYGRDFVLEGNRIRLTPKGMSKVSRPKKITGSRLGSILGHDGFRTPFRTWCAMFNFFTEEENTYFLEAGRRIEDLLRKYAEEKMNKSFRTYDPKSVGYDVFRDNEIFGGIPDGEELDEDNNVVSILEIKTAQVDKYRWTFRENQFMLHMENGRPIVAKRGGGLQKWFGNGMVTIPHSYRDQLSLYMYLRGVKRGYFCVAFLNQEDYSEGSIEFSSEFNNYRDYEDENLSLCAERERLLVWEEFTLPENFGEQVERAKRWYEDHILTGISPDLDSSDIE